MFQAIYIYVCCLMVFTGTSSEYDKVTITGISYPRFSNTPPIQPRFYINFKIDFVLDEKSNITAVITRYFNGNSDNGTWPCEYNRTVGSCFYNNTFSEGANFSAELFLDEDESLATYPKFDITYEGK